MGKDEKPSKCDHYSVGPPDEWCVKFGKVCCVLGLVSNCPDLQLTPQGE